MKASACSLAQPRMDQTCFCTHWPVSLTPPGLSSLGCPAFPGDYPCPQLEPAPSVLCGTTARRSACRTSGATIDRIKERPGIALMSPKSQQRDACANGTATGETGSYGCSCLVP